MAVSEKAADIWNNYGIIFYLFLTYYSYSDEVATSMCHMIVWLSIVLF